MWTLCIPFPDARTNLVEQYNFIFKEMLESYGNLVPGGLLDIVEKMLGGFGVGFAWKERTQVVLGDYGIFA